MRLTRNLLFLSLSQPQKMCHSLANISLHTYKQILTNIYFRYKQTQHTQLTQDGTKLISLLCVMCCIRNLIVIYSLNAVHSWNVHNFERVNKHLRYTFCRSGMMKYYEKLFHTKYPKLFNKMSFFNVGGTHLFSNIWIYFNSIYVRQQSLFKSVYDSKSQCFGWKNQLDLEEKFYF